MKTLNKIEERALLNAFNDKVDQMIDVCNSTTNPKLTAAMLLGIIDKKDIDKIFFNPTFKTILLKIENSYLSSSRKEKEDVSIEIKEVSIVENTIRYELNYSETRTKYKQLGPNESFSTDKLNISEEGYKALETKEISYYSIDREKKDYVTYNVHYTNLTSKETITFRTLYECYDKLQYKGDITPNDGLTLLRDFLDI